MTCQCARGLTPTEPGLDLAWRGLPSPVSCPLPRTAPLVLLCDGTMQNSIVDHPSSPSVSTPGTWPRPCGGFSLHGNSGRAAPSLVHGRPCRQHQHINPYVSQQKSSAGRREGAKGRPPARTMPSRPFHTLLCAHCLGPLHRRRPSETGSVADRVLVLL